MTTPSQFDRRQRQKARVLRVGAVAGLVLFAALFVLLAWGRNPDTGESYWRGGAWQFLAGLAVMAAVGAWLWRRVTRPRGVGRD